MYVCTYVRINSFYFYHSLPAGPFSPGHVCTATVDTLVKYHCIPQTSSFSSLQPTAESPKNEISYVYNNLYICMYYDHVVYICNMLASSHRADSIFTIYIWTRILCDKFNYIKLDTHLHMKSNYFTYVCTYMYIYPYSLYVYLHKYVHMYVSTYNSINL